MRKMGLLALLLLPRWAMAFGGSSESWLGGTRPWDTVPYFEANVGLQAHGGQGQAGLGPLLEAGLLDQLMLSGAYDQPADGSAGSGEALLTLRETGFPRWRPALAATLRSVIGPRGTQWRPGLVAAVEPWDFSIVANVEDADGSAALRFGAWTPYLTSFFRVGFEACSSTDLGAPWRLLPQATLQFPGDISFVLGGETLSQGSAAWSWLARASYQLFPSP